MKKQSLSLTEIKKLHQSGELREAENAYLKLLEGNPELWEAMHGLGLLYAEEGSLDKAQDYFEQALAIASHNPTLSLHLANILKAKGLFNKALTVLESLTKEHPDYAAGFNNLGTVYYALAELDKAVMAYQQAIDLRSDYLDAYYNLALALTKLGKKVEAQNAYEAVIALNPEHAGAHFQLGCLFMQMSSYRDAIQQFQNINRSHPYHFETKTNLATCYLKLGQLNEARDYYLEALAITPQDLQVLYNLGVIYMQQGNLAEAIRFYSQAATLDPNLFAVHNNLAFAYLVMKQNALALHHFQEALRLSPDNEAIAHTINILKHDKTIKTSPPAYVRSLFNSYADHFDAHLLQVLNYQVPELLLASLKKVSVPQANLTVLDLGCGTGLSGITFKPLAARLVGVDISENMLMVADKKQVYDELVHADILPFLEDSQLLFDLIVASDVLVYYGELEALFAAVAKTLKSGGLFLLNTEITEEADYLLLPSGRFAHRQTYIEKCAIDNHLTLLLQESKPLRLQNQTPVYGNLFIFQS